jgi:hypothetical protein
MLQYSSRSDTNRSQKKAHIGIVQSSKTLLNLNLQIHKYEREIFSQIFNRSYEMPTSVSASRVSSTSSTSSSTGEEMTFLSLQLELVKESCRDDTDWDFRPGDLIALRCDTWLHFRYVLLHITVLRNNCVV